MSSSRKNRSRHRSHKPHHIQKLEDPIIETNPAMHGPLPCSTPVARAMEHPPAAVEAPRASEQTAQDTDASPYGIRRRRDREIGKGSENVTRSQSLSERRCASLSIFDPDVANERSTTSLDRWEGGDIHANGNLSFLASFDLGKEETKIARYYSVNSGKASSCKGDTTRGCDVNVPKKNKDIKASYSYFPDADSIVESGRKRGKSSEVEVLAVPNCSKAEEFPMSRKSEDSQKLRKFEDALRARNEAEGVDDHKDNPHESRKFAIGTELVLLEDHRNLELEKELESRIGKRREESRDRDTRNDDNQDRERRRPHYHRDNYRKDGYRDDRWHRDDKFKNKRGLGKDTGDVRHQDDKGSRHIEDTQDRWKADKNCADMFKDENQNTENDTYDGYKINGRLREGSHKGDSSKDEGRDSKHTRDKDGRQKDDELRDRKHERDKKSDDEQRVEKELDEWVKSKKHNIEVLRSGKDRTEGPRGDRDWSDRPGDEKERSGRQRVGGISLEDKERDEWHKDENHDRLEDLEKDTGARSLKCKDVKDTDETDGRRLEKLLEDRKGSDKHQDVEYKKQRRMDEKCEEEQRDDKNTDASVRIYNEGDEKASHDLDREKKDRYDQKKGDRGRHKRSRDDNYEKQRDDRCWGDKHGEDCLKTEGFGERHGTKILTKDGKQSEEWNKLGKHHRFDQECSLSGDERSETNGHGKENSEQIQSTFSHEHDLRENLFFDNLEKQNVQSGDSRASMDDAHDQERLFPTPAGAQVVYACTGEHELKRPPEYGSGGSLNAERPNGQQGDHEATGEKMTDKSTRKKKDLMSQGQSRDDVHSKGRVDQQLDRNAAESHVKKARTSSFQNCVESSPKLDSWSTQLDGLKSSPSPSVFERNHTLSFDKSARGSKFETSMSAYSGGVVHLHRGRNRQSVGNLDQVKQRHYSPEDEARSWKSIVLHRGSEDDRKRSFIPEKNQDLPSLLSTRTLPLIQEESSRDSMSFALANECTIEHDHQQSFCQGGGPLKVPQMDGMFQERTEWVQQGLWRRRPLGSPMIRPQLTSFPCRPSGAPGLLLPPPLRPGNLAFPNASIHAFEERPGCREVGRYDGTAGDPHKRTKIGGPPGPGDAWRGFGMGNWNNPNQGPGPRHIFAPFSSQVLAHPSVGFLGMGQQFPLPSLFGPGGGARPSLKIGFGVSGFHVGDRGLGFPCQDAPAMDWRRSGEQQETCYPPQSPLDPQQGRGPFADECQSYTRQEWQQDAQRMCGQRWDKVPDVLQSHENNSDTSHRIDCQREDAYQGGFGEDEALFAVQGHLPCEHKLPQENSSIERAEATDSYEAIPASSVQNLIIRVPFNEVKPTKRYADRTQMLLSNLDVSAKLCGTDLYRQYLSLLPAFQAEKTNDNTFLEDHSSESTEDDFDCQLDPEAYAMVCMPDPFSQFVPPLPESVFKEALSVYQRPAQENRVQKSALGSFLLPVSCIFSKLPQMQAKSREGSSQLSRAELKANIEQAFCLKAMDAVEAGACDASVDDGVNEVFNSTKDALCHDGTEKIKRKEQVLDKQISSPAKDCQSGSPSEMVDPSGIKVNEIIEGSAEDVVCVKHICQFQHAAHEGSKNIDDHGIALQTLQMVVNCIASPNVPPIEINSKAELFSETDMQSSVTEFLEAVPIDRECCNCSNLVEGGKVDAVEPIARVVRVLDGTGDMSFCCADADAANELADTAYRPTRSLSQKLSGPTSKILDGNISQSGLHVEGKGNEGQLHGKGCARAEVFQVDGNEKAGIIAKEAEGKFEMDEVKEIVSNACMVFFLTKVHKSSLLTSSPFSALQC